MRRKLIPEQDIVNLSKKVIHCFYSRDIKDNVHYLADDFIWIGGFEFQFTKSKEEFFKIAKSEMESIPFKILDEEFFLISKTSNCYTVCGRYKLMVETAPNDYIITSTRLTMIWKYYGNDLKLFHVHGSNAQDVPLNIYDKNESNLNDNDFISYLTSLNNDNIKNKISFKDCDGTYHYFLENEILYLQADLQNTYIITTKDKIKLPGILAENAKKLPSSFYRVHKSFVVNSNYVKTLKRYIITLQNGEELPIGKEKYIPFREFTQN